MLKFRTKILTSSRWRNLTPNHQFFCRNFSAKSIWESKAPHWDPVKNKTEDKYGRVIRTKPGVRWVPNSPTEVDMAHMSYEEIENIENRREWEIRVLPVYDRIEKGRTPVKKLRSAGFIPAAIRAKKPEYPNEMLIKFYFSFVQSEIDRGGFWNRKYYLDLNESGKHILVKVHSYYSDHRFVPIYVNFVHETDETQAYVMNLDIASQKDFV